MRAEDIHATPPPKPLLYSLADSPHATVESNRNCNMACRACYNLERRHVKSLEEISAEIDSLCKRRNLGVITILGGEPTLHPRLAEIVSRVKRHRLACQLLTNGKAFLEPLGTRLLDDLAAAGIDKILLHADSGQGLADPQVQARRAAIFRLLEERRVRYSLALTIYNGEVGSMAHAVRQYAALQFFDGVLAVLARGCDPGGEQAVQMIDACRRIEADLHVPPVAYIPSSRADDEVCWLLYMFFINARSGCVLALPSWLNRAFRRFYRLVHGRHFFVIRGRPGWAWAQCLGAGVLAAAVRPASLPGLLRLMRGSSWLRNIRLHYIAVQEPPLFDAAGSLVRICRHCPDATMRNGRLTPVCIADAINPLNAATGEVREDWRRIAYAHLGESV